MNTYDKLIHFAPSSKEYTVVNWCIGNTCNYSCTYCPDNLHDGSFGWFDYDEVEHFCNRVINHFEDKKLYFEFTGGEVTMWRHFPKLAEFLKDNGADVGLISNGSRTVRWWKEHKKLFDNVSISYHPEQADLEHLVEVFTEIRRDLKTHCNVMMHPKKELFDKGVKLANNVVRLSDITLALQPLIVGFQTELYEYTDEQMEIIDNQVKLFCNRIRYSKEWPIYRGPMVAVNSKTDQKDYIPTHVLISRGLNNWEGWKCYAGVEQIIVDLDGRVWRGWCKVGKQLGWIQRGRRLVFPKDPIICTKDFCHCNFDIMCTKEKNDEN